MADFPARSQAPSAGGVVFGVFLLCVWLVAIIMMVHGAFTRDIWEVVTAAVIMVVLLITRAVLASYWRS